MFEKELEIAINLAREAGNCIMEFYEKGFQIHQKMVSRLGIIEPVTEADKAAEEIIVHGIKQNFPDDGILSEEDDDNLERLSKQRVWIIDPIDGTKGFVEKSKDFAVHIGFVFHGKPSLGVVYQPALQRFFFAFKEGGAFLSEHENSPKKLSVAQKTNFDEMILVRSRLHPSQKISEIFKRLNFKDQIAYGSVGLKIGLIAEGKADVYIHLSPHTKFWDTCAPQVILEEAGGVLTDLFGEELRYDLADTQNYNGILATNLSAHQKLVESLRPILKEFGRVK
jgi:3'(2'), 5'-bisphosphate nucleotidase